MKKMKFGSIVLLMAVSLPLIISCGSDDSDDEKSSPLVGTKWTSTIHDQKYILEFSSASEVLLYEADVNNNYVDNLEKGKYSFNGNAISFNKSIILSHSYSFSFDFTYYYFKTANISGNTMTIITDEKEVKVSISTGTSEEKEKGEKKFTFMKV